MREIAIIFDDGRISTAIGKSKRECIKMFFDYYGWEPDGLKFANVESYMTIYGVKAEIRWELSEN